MLSGWRPRHYGGEPLEVGIVVCASESSDSG
jgi:hypothetical protein